VGMGMGMGVGNKHASKQQPPLPTRQSHLAQAGEKPVSWLGLDDSSGVIDCNRISILIHF